MPEGGLQAAHKDYTVCKCTRWPLLGGVLGQTPTREEDLAVCIFHEVHLKVCLN